MATPFQPLPKMYDARSERKNGSGGSDSTAPPVFDTALRKKRILHVEFDRTLLAIRHTLLETAGFEVVSCFNATGIREVSTATAPFDVFLVGHSAPADEREDLVIWMKTNFPETRIVVLRKRETDSTPSGHLAATVEPEDLIRTLLELFKRA